MRVCCLLCCLGAAAGLMLPRATASLRQHASVARQPAPRCGLFDLFKESEASKRAKEEAWQAQQEMLERRRSPEKFKEYTSAHTNAYPWSSRIPQRRRRPSASGPLLGGRYIDEVEERRRETMSTGSELKALQTTDAAGADTLEAWKQLKEEGKVKSSDDMERDADSSRLGSEGASRQHACPASYVADSRARPPIPYTQGLIAERIDENLPYIDQGYVTDDQPDFMGELGKLGSKLFGGGEKQE
eukprot:Transcript_18525.p1 GENE.Transcript_18525~~Transcript_18525.p1  ORF type:complete len:244 (-),score=58.41 Transcript_18525:380-1111(-)